jgi:very-short-patch-repair endonuclease
METKKTGYIDYNKDLKSFSRKHRNNSTLGEILLWNQLKAGRMLGYKFNRQKPLGNFIADFYCKNLNLVIEVDGCSHNDRYEKDMEREKKLNKMGLTVLRFTEQQCRKDMINVVRGIESWIEDIQQPIPPAPLYKGEKANTKSSV